MILWLTLLATAQSIEPVAQVTESLIQFTRSSCGSSRVVVLWLGLNEKLLPDFDTLKWTGSPCRARPELRLAVAKEGREVGRWSVRPQLERWVLASVASAPVLPGMHIPITQAEVAQERVVGQPVVGNLIALRAIKAGEAITQRNARQRPDALKGAMVRIEVVSGGLMLHAEGRLLQDATLGERVKVLNQATHVINDGTLVETGVVRLR